MTFAVGDTVEFADEEKSVGTLLKVLAMDRESFWARGENSSYGTYTTSLWKKVEEKFEVGKLYANGRDFRFRVLYVDDDYVFFKRDNVTATWDFTHNRSKYSEVIEVSRVV